MSGLMQTSIKSLPLVYRGKVRECYAVGEDKLLMIATDRISAFDFILSVPVPNKGKGAHCTDAFLVRQAYSRSPDPTDRY